MSESVIWDARAGRAISENELVGALARARYRLLGEVHDHPAHHAIRARLVSALAGAGLRPAVVFEQFDLGVEEALAGAQAAPADAEALADAGRLDRKAWRWPLHKPIVEAAIAMRLPVRPANLPRERLRAADGDARWKGRLGAARWTEAQAKMLHDDIVEGHCGKLPHGVVPRLVQSQRMRDAAMAQALVEAATADGAILIAGNGHVRADVGVPVYLEATAGDDSARSISVGFIETDAFDTSTAMRLANQLAGRFDYVWLTSRIARDDPCASLR